MSDVLKFAYGFTVAWLATMAGDPWFEFLQIMLCVALIFWFMGIVRSLIRRGRRR